MVHVDRTGRAMLHSAYGSPKWTYCSRNPVCEADRQKQTQTTKLLIPCDQLDM